MSSIIYSLKRLLVYLPNLLSFYRLLITPVVVILILLDWPQSRIYVASLTISAWLSDILDGILARTLALDSDLGESFDWLADKVFILSVFMAFISTGKVPVWVVIIMVIREVIITQIRYYCALKGIIEKVDKLGKLKLGVSMVAIILLSITDREGQLFLYLALMLTIISGINYFIIAAKHLAIIE